MITRKCLERALLISKRRGFVFESQHPIDPLWITLSGRVTDLGIIYGSFLTLAFPWEIVFRAMKVTARSAHKDTMDKSKVTAIIRAERLAVSSFIFYPTKTYIISLTCREVALSLYVFETPFSFVTIDPSTICLNRDSTGIFCR